MTNADALRLFLTGATTDGAEQTAHALSLGGYTSSVEASGLGIFQTDAILGVTIDLAVAENGAGVGTLAAVGTGSLAWTPPGGSQGSEVAIADGETKVITGVDPSKFIRVTRFSADDLFGTATVTLRQCLGTVIAHREAQSTGLTTYSAVILKNLFALAATNLQVWIDPLADSRLFIGQEAGSLATGSPISDASLLGDTYPPDGVTITNQGTTAGTGLQIGTIAAGERIGIWLKRAVEVSADASPSIAISPSFHLL